MLQHHNEINVHSEVFHNHEQTMSISKKNKEIALLNLRPIHNFLFHFFMDLLMNQEPHNVTMQGHN